MIRQKMQWIRGLGGGRVIRAVWVLTILRALRALRALGDFKGARYVTLSGTQWSEWVSLVGR